MFILRSHQVHTTRLLPTQKRGFSKLSPQQLYFQPHQFNSHTFHSPVAPYSLHNHSEIDHLKLENSRLAKEVVRLEARVEKKRQNYDKLLEKVNIRYARIIDILSLKAPPRSLKAEDYEDVKFWTEKAYDACLKRNDGDTDGLATKKARRGRPTMTRTSIHTSKTTWDFPSAELAKVGDKAQKVFNSLTSKALAPQTWGQLVF
ncbi:hypothetical protein D9615_004973 [Tricholomella constricta]|uniref:Uncharacterized protein n=1 Tax=Tricholomella constricta TaxID=117010 RepID=A0A8H5HGE6_9AGAR|nr:hypothetical protein D9615_004973 [Tricholomella constricta]